VIENGSRRIPRDFNLHWGKGQIVEEASIQGEHHQPSVQLLEFQDGSTSIRFSVITTSTVGFSEARS